MDVELDVSSPLGDYLRQRRQEQGLSMADVGARCGMSRENVRLLEAGQTTNPTISTLDGIARALRVPLETLIRLALGRELSRPALEAELAALMAGLPEPDQLEILTTVEALTHARRKRLGL